MSITYIVKMVPKPGKREELEKSFEAAKVFPGLLRFETYRSEDGNTIMCVEEWKDQESIDKFFGSMSQKELDAWMALLVQEPEYAAYNKV